MTFLFEGMDQFELSLGSSVTGMALAEIILDNCMQ